MAKVWQKDGLGQMDPDVEKYCVGMDYILDGRLFYYELAASLAHAMMLKKIGILTPEEYRAIEKEIRLLYKNNGKTMTLEFSDEDIHSKLENLLTGSIGEAGKKLHTGRSRNDQVLTVMRLYEKDSLLDTALDYIGCLEEISLLARREGNKILPGYTHAKQAMLMNVKFWAASFIDAGFDNLRIIKSVFDLIDANPLGTGSSFGVPFALDRELTAEILGFSRIQENALAVHNSRGKFESFIIDALWSIMNDFSRIASDLLIYNMDELNYIKTSQSITTGSSIMPQKRNLDVMELVRARTSTMTAYSAEVKCITGGLLSGYNRDIQETKEPLMKSFNLVLDTIKAVKAVFKNISFDEEAVKRNLSKGILATDFAFNAVKEGMPFRDAYRFAAGKIDDIKITDKEIEESIEKRVSRGSPANVDLRGYKKGLESLKKYFSKTAENFRGKLSVLLE